MTELINYINMCNIPLHYTLKRILRISLWTVFCVCVWFCIVFSLPTSHRIQNTWMKTAEICCEVDRILLAKLRSWIIEVQISNKNSIVWVLIVANLNAKITVGESLSLNIYFLKYMLLLSGLSLIFQLIVDHNSLRISWVLSSDKLIRVYYVFSPVGHCGFISLKIFGSR